MDKFVLDGHKLYWHLDRVAAWQNGQLVAPIYVEISPVSFCNHQCIFCGLDFAHTEHICLDSNVLQGRISEMARLGVKSIMFAGEGEPLLHPQIVALTTHCKTSGIDVSITTNGMLGNSILWQQLLPSLTWIRFSIDAATPEIYANVHKVASSSFQRTLQSLKDAVEIKKSAGLSTTIGVQFLMIKQNIDDIEEAIRLYSNIGVDYLSFKPYSEHPQMHNKSSFTYSTEMISEIEEIVKRYQAKDGNTSIIFRKAATEVYSEGSHHFSSCCALPFWGYISSRGDFYTCSVYLNDERFRVGNIMEESMETIFAGERRKRSIDFARYELKIGCECRINCRMARINEFLEFLSSKPSHINFI